MMRLRHLIKSLHALPRLAGFSPLALLSACGMVIMPPQAPTAIALPEGHMVANILSGEGVLRYACRASPGGQFFWVGLAPEVVLKDQSGAMVGHYRAGADASPSWEHVDGSRVSATAVSSTTGTGSLGPQLLKATPTAGSRRGAMTGVTFIQQLNTRSGTISGSCNPTKFGSVEAVPYTADYYFYKPDFSDRVEPM